MRRHHSTSELGPSRIQVCVRKRPLSQAELNADEEDVVTVTSRTTIELSVPKLAVDLTKYTQKVNFYTTVLSLFAILLIIRVTIVTVVIIVYFSISLYLMKLLMKVVIIKMFMREQHDHSSKQYSTGKYSD